MKPAEILYQLRDLNEEWRKQSFAFTNEQQEKYSNLIAQRRERVKFFYDNNLVSKGGLRKKDEVQEEEQD